VAGLPTGRSGPVIAIRASAAPVPSSRCRDRSDNRVDWGAPALGTSSGNVVNAGTLTGLLFVALSMNTATALSKGPHGSWRLAEQAFSRPTGRVDIQCQEEGEEFILLWTERGGLVQGEPASEGFGSQLSRAAVSGRGW